ncbi:metallophosphoesterase [Thermoproteota archaeon]
MKRLIIGDIHGCYTELQELLSKAGVTLSDEIIALGDIVDRGPDSPQVLEFFRGRPNTRSIIGNHERKHVRSFAGEVRPALSQRITRRQIGEAHYASACEFMDSLDRFIELPEAILVHGFFEPGVPLAEQRETVIVGTLSGKHYLEKYYEGEWYKLYDGEKPLIVGHLDYLHTGQPLIWNDRVFCIDTGCCYGGALTGLLLPDFHILSVQSRGDHWREARRKYADIAYQATADTDLSWDKVEALIRSLAGQAELSQEQGERLSRLSRMLKEAEHLLRILHDRIVQENGRTLASLRAQCAFDELSSADQGRLYAARIGKTPLGTLLHRARKGALDLAGLRAKFKKPKDLEALATRIGLINGAKDDGTK